MHAFVQGWCGSYFVSVLLLQFVRYGGVSTRSSPLTKRPPTKGGKSRRGQKAPLRGSAVALRARGDDAAYSFLNRGSHIGVAAMPDQLQAGPDETCCSFVLPAVHRTWSSSWSMLTLASDSYTLHVLGYS